MTAVIVLFTVFLTSSDTPAPDLSTPLAAVRSLYQAVERADEAAIRAVFFAEDDAQRSMIDAYATLIISGRRLADAAEKRYGQAADGIARGALPDLEIARLDAAVVRETDDTATLKTPTMPRPIQLRRSDAGWQIVLDAPADPERAEPQVKLTRELAAAMSELADEIAAGKHPTIQDAETALQQRINEVMTEHVRRSPPATRPDS